MLSLILFAAFLPQQTPGKLDVNTATAAELRALPGMGDEYVRRVIRYRPYSAKNQIATRGILPQAEYGRIQELVVAHRQHPSTVNAGAPKK